LIEGNRAMAIVDLEVSKIRGKWTVKLRDARGVQYLGETRSRSEIEAFTARLMADLVAQGDCPLLKVPTAPPSERTDKGDDDA
jgi:hypothetical protein